MSETPQLKLPLLQPSQAQKHVTVNEALTALDALVQLGVISSALNAPPTLSAEGDRYIVGAAPTGAWAGMARRVAAWTNGAWVFYAPLDGWVAWDKAAAAALVFSVNNWQAFGGGGGTINTLPELGINILPDATNKFAFSGTNALMTSAGSLDLTLNKAAVGNDASVTFKSGFSARALVGLLGNNNFSIKVSGNGTTFATPLIANATTGKVSTFDATANGFTLTDGTDVTKAAVFALSGISTGTTRTLTLPNTSQTLAHIGNASQTFAGQTVFSNASVTVGNATATATYDLGSGVTIAGSTKTVNLGSAGASGSTTIVNIGSTVAGAAGSLVVNTPSVTFANTVTSVSMPQATVAAGLLGVGGATADATNRLNVNTSNVLLNNAGSSLDITVNKAATGDDASLTFKSGFSARALLGLLANEDLSLKVSPDGSAYFVGLTVDRGTGRVSLPQGAAIGALTTDPVTPQDGLIWYNATTAQLRARLGGTTRIVNGDQVAFVQPLTGDFIPTTIGTGTTTGTLIGVANRIDMFPFIPKADVTVDQIAVSVTTAVAAAQGKTVVYASNGSGQPTARLFESAALDFSTVGFKTAALSLVLRKGLVYWIGIRHSSTATLSAHAATSTPDLTTSDLSTQFRKVLRRTVTFATAAPDPWAYVSTETANAVATATWFRST